GEEAAPTGAAGGHIAGLGLGGEGAVFDEPVQVRCLGGQKGVGPTAVDADDEDFLLGERGAGEQCQQDDHADSHFVLRSSTTVSSRSSRKRMMAFAQSLLISKAAPNVNSSKVPSTRSTRKPPRAKPRILHGLARRTSRRGIVSR